MSVPRCDAPPKEIVAAYKRDVATANKAKLKSEQIASLLDSWRRGDETARIKLTNALRYLVYQVGRDGEKKLQYHWLSEMFIGLETAIERLQNNDRTDVKKFVSDELHRSIRAFKKSESRNISPPASTNCTRVKNGKAAYRTLRRIDLPSGPAGGQQGSDDDSVGKLEWSDLRVNLHPERDFNATDFRLDVCLSEKDEIVFELLAQGYSQPQVAATAGITTYAVGQIVESFRQRSIRAGYAQPSWLSKAVCA